MRRVRPARSVSDATLMRERSPLSASSLASAWRRAHCERRDRRSHFSSWDKRPPCYSSCALLHSASIIAHRVHQHVKAIFGMWQRDCPFVTFTLVAEPHLHFSSYSASLPILRECHTEYSSRFVFIWAFIRSLFTESNTVKDAGGSKKALLVSKHPRKGRITRFLLVAQTVLPKTGLARPQRGKLTISMS